MDINWKMYGELDRLRAKLKEHGKRIQGRAPVVCSDETFLQMAEFRQKNSLTLKALPGSGGHSSRIMVNSSFR